MLSYFHTKCTTCKSCDTGFFYDPSIVKRAPRVCPTCKTSGIAKREQARRERIKQDTIDFSGIELRHLAERTYEEVADIMGLSPSGVRKIERAALLKIRRALEAHNKTVFPPK